MRLLTNSMRRDYPELCEWSDVLKEPTKVGDRRQRKRLL